MITEDQKIDVLADVKRRSDEWVGQYVCLGIVDIRFENLYKIFTDAEIDVKSVFNGLSAHEILELTIQACKKLGYSKVMIAYAVDNWSAEASKFLGLTQEGYPEGLK